MIDQRERILTRSALILPTVPGIIITGRNRGEVTGRRRPAIIQDDGAEEVVDLDAGDAAGSRNSLVQRMRMDVTYRILVDGSPETIGTDASTYRSALIIALWGDDELLDLLGVQNSRSSRIKFTGSSLETSDGEQREGTMTVNVAMTYVFRLADLLAA